VVTAGTPINPVFVYGIPKGAERASNRSEQFWLASPGLADRIAELPCDLTAIESDQSHGAGVGKEKGIGRDV
jgi:hypothetical protein